MSGARSEAGTLLTLTDVSRRYGGTTALRPTSIELAAGELAVLTGPSGSGKSTLLMIAAGWDTPDTGTVTPHSPLPDVPVTEFSWRQVGFVPQSVSLFDEFTLAGNVEFPVRDLDDAGDVTAGLIEALGLTSLANRLPRSTSRGEQQRAAIGRALVTAPPLVLADEPTAHQDRGSAELVLDVLRAATENGSGVLVASHDDVVLGYADREIRLG